MRARDEQIQANIAENNWQRRNDEHKKSVFYGELQRARLENRPPIYDSFLDVPDLERPRERLSLSFTTWLILGAIALALVGIVLSFVATLLQFVLQVVVPLVLLGVLAVYLVVTGIWLFKRYLKKPTSSEDLAKAEFWNPVSFTLWLVRKISDRRKAAELPQS